MRWLRFVVLVGCKFTPGELPADARAIDGAAVDASPDARGANCYAQWLDHSITFGSPQPLDTVNSSVFDRDPYTTADELTFWVSSGRGGVGGDVWIAKRANRNEPFNTPAIDPSFDSPGNETKVSLTSDGLYAVVGSDRDAPNSVDVWETERATISDNWPAPTRMHMQQVNSMGAEHDPTISADGLRLYVAPADNVNPQYIAVATRANRGLAFGAPTLIPELYSGAGDADPSPTPDERILLFGSNRPVGPNEPAPSNVWYATRAASDQAFGTPRLVPSINGDLAEGDPHLSADGCRIYFGRNLGGDNWDIFVATAL